MVNQQGPRRILILALVFTIAWTSTPTATTDIAEGFVIEAPPPLEGLDSHELPPPALEDEGMPRGVGA